MRRKIVTDIILNILASGLPIIILQFFLMPFIASRLDGNTYGYIITIIAWMNLSAFTLGNVLNNSKLIYQSKYTELNIKGDYNRLFLMFFVINFGIMITGLWYFNITFDLLNVFLIIIASKFILIRGYGIVEFRIHLNYKNILLESVFSILGNILGLLLFIVFGYWQLIYVFGGLFSFIFIISKTDIFREPYRKTHIYKDTRKKTFLLLFSGVLSSITVHLDKLLLFPLLGGVAVSIYYTATLLGKTLGLIATPITSVLLSYIARKDRIKNRHVIFLLFSSLVFGFIGYIFILILSKPVIKILYPQFLAETMNYIHIATVTIIIGIICNVLNAIILKFCDMIWQLLINAIYLVIYLIAALSLLSLYGLMGFCIGILLANIIKLILMIIIYYVTNYKKSGLKNIGLNL